jgi:hypothetical protein
LAGADANSAVIAAAVIKKCRMICLPRVFRLYLLQVAYLSPGCRALYNFYGYQGIENLCFSNRKFMNINLCL